MIGDDVYDMAEVGFDVESVEFGRLGQGEYDGGVIAAFIGTGEEPVFASKS